MEGYRRRKWEERKGGITGGEAEREQVADFIENERQGR